MDNQDTSKNELTTSPELNKKELDKESLEIINQVIAENDVAKVKDLTYLFNVNQNKKTMARVNKLGELLDTITDQAIVRFSKRPDEFSNQELFQGLKVVQDIVERGQKQVSGINETPLIQINQQTNEVNIGAEGEPMTKESRDKVKNAVLSILANAQQASSTPESEDDIIDVGEEKPKC